MFASDRIERGCLWSKFNVCTHNALVVSESRNWHTHHDWFVCVTLWIYEFLSHFDQLFYPTSLESPVSCSGFYWIKPAGSLSASQVGNSSLFEVFRTALWHWIAVKQFTQDQCRCNKRRVENIVFSLSSVFFALAVPCFRLSSTFRWYIPHFILFFFFCSC